MIDMNIYVICARGTGGFVASGVRLVLQRHAACIHTSFIMHLVPETWRRRGSFPRFASYISRCTFASIFHETFVISRLWGRSFDWSFARFDFVFAPWFSATHISYLYFANDRWRERARPLRRRGRRDESSLVLVRVIYMTYDRYVVLFLRNINVALDYAFEYMNRESCLDKWSRFVTLLEPNDYMNVQ